MPATEPTKPKKAPKKPRAPIAQKDESLSVLITELKSELFTLRDDVHELKSKLEGPTPVIQEVAEPEPEEGLSSEEMGALLEATARLSQQDQEFAAPQPVEPEQPEEPAPVKTPGQGVALSDEEIAALLAPKTDAEPTLEQPQETDTLIVPAEEIMAMLGLADPLSEAQQQAKAVSESDAAAEPLEFETTELLQENTTEPLTTALQVNLEVIDQMAVDRVPGALAAAALALPLCIEEGNLHCRCIEPFDDEAFKAIAESTGLAVVPHAGDPIDILRELRRRFSNLHDTYDSAPSLASKPLVFNFMRRKK